MNFFTAKNTAYIFFSLTIIYLGMLAYFHIVDITIFVINMHDIYFVIPVFNNCLALVIINAIVAIIYNYIKPSLKLLNFLHVVLSVVFPPMYWFAIINNDWFFINYLILIVIISFLINVTYTLVNYGIKSFK
jgi:hypothetical protein